MAGNEQYNMIYINENGIIGRYYEIGWFAWWIQKYDIYFSSKDVELGKKKMNSLIFMIQTNNSQCNTKL